MNSPTLHVIDDIPNAYDAYNTNDANSDATNNMDTRDTRDIHAFQLESQGKMATTDTCKIAMDGWPDVLEGPGDESIEFDSQFLSTSSVVIEGFPFGNPGAPIPEMPQGPSYEQFCATPWAPFQSQRDWDIAHWAKMHSTTLSAVADLLALPNVCPTQSS